MSRITKEEIEKTKCGRFLLSDENIYLSIYSLNSYVCLTYLHSMV